LSEEWLFGIPPPLLIIGLIIGIPLLLWLVSEGFVKFIGAVVQAIYVLFGGKPGSSSKRTRSKDIKAQKSVPYGVFFIVAVAWMLMLWVFPFHVWVGVGLLLMVGSIVYVYMFGNTEKSKKPVLIQRIEESMENKVAKNLSTGITPSPSKEKNIEENVVPKRKFVKCDYCSNEYDLNKTDQCPKCGRFRKLGLVGDGTSPVE
jgi:hypothetical protein